MIFFFTDIHATGVNTDCILYTQVVLNEGFKNELEVYLTNGKLLTLEYEGEATRAWDYRRLQNAEDSRVL